MKTVSGLYIRKVTKSFLKENKCMYGQKPHLPSLYPTLIGLRWWKPAAQSMQEMKSSIT